jgi:protein-S-isoprenylcysteine O-methyltransferase Ste14
MNHGPALPPLYLFTSLAVMVLLHFFLPVYEITPYPLNAIGLIPLALGIILNLAADNALKKHDTTVKPFEESTRLITTGVYKYSRNPMYLGMILIMIGVALLMGSLTPYIIVAVFIVAIEQVFIRAEESTLHEKFGHDWTAYREKVRRWL